MPNLKLPALGIVTLGPIVVGTDPGGTGLVRVGGGITASGVVQIAALTTPLGITNSAAAGANTFVQYTRGSTVAGYLGADAADNLTLNSGVSGLPALTVNRSTGQLSMANGALIAALTTPLGITNAAAAGANAFMQLTRGSTVTGYIGADASDNLTLMVGGSGAVAVTVDRSTGQLTIAGLVKAAGLPTSAGATGTLYVDGSGFVKRA